MAMEDFRVDVVVGKGPGATAIPLEIAPFTLVGATTRAGLLTGAAARPVRLRRAHGVLRAGRAAAGAAPQSPGCSGVDARPTTAPPRSPAARAARRGSPTGCCAGSATTPRCGPTGGSTAPIARAALAVYDVDELGLDRLDRAVLDALVAGSAAGRSASPRWPSRWGRSRSTVEEVCRAVPGPGRPAGPHAARPGRHRRRPGHHLGPGRRRGPAPARSGWLRRQDGTGVGPTRCAQSSDDAVSRLPRLPTGLARARRRIAPRRSEDDPTVMAAAWCPSSFIAIAVIFLLRAARAPAQPGAADAPAAAASLAPGTR